MALTMRHECDRCRAPLAARAEAYICSYECTFCPACVQAVGWQCPTCGGELARRPRRVSGGLAPYAHARGR